MSQKYTVQTLTAVDFKHYGLVQLIFKQSW